MTIDELNRISKNSFSDRLGIVFTGFDGNRITGEIHITENHLQPHGVVHGGVYISLAETLAGAGSIMLIADEGKTALGTNINSTHIAATREGRIAGEAMLVHRGAFKHIWDVKITDDNGKLISMSRVSNSIRELKNQEEKRR